MNKRSTLAFLTVIIFFNVAVAQPAGYYNNAAGKSCAALKTALKTIITTGNTPQTYTALWGQYEISDVKPREVGTGSAMVIWDIYSDRPTATDPYNFTPGTGTGGQQDQGSGGTSEGQFYNREHSIPLSWFNGSTGTSGPATDYTHIFPVDKYVNGRRANFPYGEVGTATFTSLNGSKLGTSSFAGITGSVFEPIDSFKGDVARAFLYFVTRYEDDMPVNGLNPEALQAFEPNTFPSVDVPYIQLMIKWHNLDPVSKKEIDRNNAGYIYQGNRNPYIDHPEYVSMVWNSTCPGLSALPVDIVFFSGKLVGSAVQLKWQTQNEVNLDRFEVEKSFNGREFNKIGQVNAANAKDYQYNDEAENNSGRRIYYRLKKIDKDGKFSYSEIFTLHVPLNTKFTISPNPATTFVKLQLNRPVQEKVSIQIVNALGMVVSTQDVKVDGNSIMLSTEKIANGSYLVKMIVDGQEYVQRLVIAK